MLDLARLLQLAGVLNESVQIDEAREDFVAQQLGDKVQQAYMQDRGQKPKLDTPLAIVQYVSHNTNPKFIQKIMGWYVAGEFKLEDVHRIKSDLETFDRVKARLEKKDINQYKTLRDLYAAIEPHEQTDIKSKRQEKQEVKEEGVRKVIDKPNFKVLELLTKEAACFYGKGTKWCTAADSNNMFDHYHKQGSIYVIIAGDRKFQLHFESGQFMDEKDQDIKNNKADIEYLSKFPEYAEFLNMLIKKHYPVENLK